MSDSGSLLGMVDDNGAVVARRGLSAGVREGRGVGCRGPHGDSLPAPSAPYNAPARMFLRTLPSSVTHANLARDGTALPANAVTRRGTSKRRDTTILMPCNPLPPTRR